MVTSIFQTIGEVVTQYAGTIADVFENLIAIFYNTETQTMTLFGTLFLIAVGVSIVVWAFNLIRNLVRL